MLLTTFFKHILIGSPFDCSRNGKQGVGMNKITLDSTLMIRKMVFLYLCLRGKDDNFCFMVNYVVIIILLLFFFLNGQWNML